MNILNNSEGLSVKQQTAKQPPLKTAATKKILKSDSRKTNQTKQTREERYDTLSSKSYNRNSKTTSLELDDCIRSSDPNITRITPIICAPTYKYLTYKNFVSILYLHTKFFKSRRFSFLRNPVFLKCAFVYNKNANSREYMITITLPSRSDDISFLDLKFAESAVNKILKSFYHYCTYADPEFSDFSKIRSLWDTFRSRNGPAMPSSLRYHVPSDERKILKDHVLAEQQKTIECNRDLDRKNKLHRTTDIFENSFITDLNPTAPIYEPLNNNTPQSGSYYDDAQNDLAYAFLAEYNVEYMDALTHIPEFNTEPYSMSEYLTILRSILSTQKQCELDAIDVINDEENLANSQPEWEEKENSSLLNAEIRLDEIRHYIGVLNLKIQVVSKSLGYIFPIPQASLTSESFGEFSNLLRTAADDPQYVVLKQFISLCIASLAFVDALTSDDCSNVLHGTNYIMHIARIYPDQVEVFVNYVASLNVKAQFFGPICDLEEKFLRLAQMCVLVEADPKGFTEIKFATVLSAYMAFRLGDEVRKGTDTSMTLLGDLVAFIAFVTKRIWEYSVTGDAKDLLNDPDSFAGWRQEAMDMLDFNPSFEFAIISEKEGTRAFLKAIDDLVKKNDTLISRGNMIFNASYKSRFNQTVLIQKLIEQLRMKSATISADFLVCEARPEPMGIMFVGLPGCGKSTLISPICGVLASGLEEDYLPSYKYNMPIGEKFLSGFKGLLHKFIVFDDPNISISNPSCDAQHILRIINSAPYAPDMADLKDKGTQLMRPLAVLITANDETMHVEGTVTNPVAVLRRLSLVIDVYSLPQYCKEGSDVIVPGLVPPEFSRMAFPPLQLFSVKHTVQKVDDGGTPTITYVLEPSMTLNEGSTRRTFTSIQLLDFLHKYAQKHKHDVIDRFYSLDKQSNQFCARCMKHGHSMCDAPIESVNTPQIFSDVSIFLVKTFVSNMITTIWVAVLAQFSYAYFMAQFILYRQTIYDLKEEYVEDLKTSIKTTFTLSKEARKKLVLMTALFGGVAGIVFLAKTIRPKAKNDNEISVPDTQSVQLQSDDIKGPINSRYNTLKRGGGAWDVTEKVSVPSNVHQRTLTMSDLIGKVKRNLVRIEYASLQSDGLHNYKGSGYFICSSFLVTARHVAEEFTDVTVFFRSSNNHLNDKQVYFDHKQIWYEAGKDIALIYLPGFVTSSLLEYLPLFSMAGFNVGDNGFVVAKTEDKPIEIASIGKYHISGGSDFDLSCNMDRTSPSQPGDSGSPVTCNINGNRVIVGVHSCYDKVQYKSGVTLLSFEFFKLIQTRCNPVPLGSSIVLDSVDNNNIQQLSSKCDFTHMRANEDVYVTAGTILGTVPGYHSSTNKSRVVPTPTAHYFPYKQEKFMPDFSSGLVDGVYQSPYRHNSRALASLKCRISIMDTQAMAEQFAETLPECYVIPVLNDYEMILGIPGNPHINSLVMKTSGGYPFSGAKRSLFLNLDSERPIMVEQLQTMYDNIIKMLRDGDTTVSAVFGGAVKDEPVSWKKLLSHKARLFGVANVAFNMLVRKFFLPWFSYFKGYWKLTGFAIGMNVYSSIWGEVKNHLSQKPNIIAGDYVSYDKKLEFSLTLAPMYIIDYLIKKFHIIDWLPYLDFMWQLAIAFCMPTYLLNGDLITMQGTIASGFALTADWNSLVNLVLMSICYKSITNGNFVKDCFYIFYGDDHVITTSNKLFSFKNIKVWMTEMGFGYTDADKSSNDDTIYSWDSVIFLKRRWFYNPDVGYITAPIDMTTIRKMTTVMVKSKTEDLLDQNRDILADAHFELSMHPKEFQMYDPIFRAIFKDKYPNIAPLPTYDDYVKTLHTSYAPADVIFL